LKSSGMPMKPAPRPDDLARALGLVVAKLHGEWTEQTQRMALEARASIAELEIDMLKRVDAFGSRIDAAIEEMRAEVRAIPVPKDADPEVTRRMVADAVAALPVPKDGKDADPKVIRRLVAEAVAALPVPKDGRDADPEVTRRLVADAVAALPAPKDGKDADPEVTRRMIADAVAALPVPKDGKDADPEVTRRMIAEAVAALPVPKDGKDADPEVTRRMIAEAVAALPLPKDGKDADPEVTRRMIAEAVAALPAPKDGKDADPEVTRRMIADAVAALPVPKDGKDADPEMTRRMIAEAVAALPVPKEARGIASAIINRDGELILTMTDGGTVNAGMVAGRDADAEQIARAAHDAVAALPRPKDGLDGLGFDDLQFEYDGERSITFKVKSGDRIKAFDAKMPVIIDRGVWRERAYEPGDGVTWRGSFWIAQKETSAKPDEASADWRLAVKRGRDGKDKL
jgi:hypothetical protein